MSTMTPVRAKAILVAIPDTQLSSTSIRSPLEYIDTNVEEYEDGIRRVRLDGYFTADELEALAMWMRDPSAVSNAG